MQKHSVLVIDDNQIDVLIATKFLEMSNLFSAIHVAQNGADALVALKNLSPDYVLLDINMPILDGWEFLDAFDSLFNQTQNQPKIVMLTSSINIDDANRAVNHPSITEFLVKPIKATKVEQFIGNP